MGNFIISGAVVRKAGANVATTIPELAFDEWISGAEAYINVATGKNWSDVYTTLNADVKHILSDTAANLAGANAVTYDMSGYTSRIEAEDIINVLLFRANQNIKILKEMGSKKFMSEA